MSRAPCSRSTCRLFNQAAHQQLVLLNRHNASVLSDANIASRERSWNSGRMLADTERSPSRPGPQCARPQQSRRPTAPASPPARCQFREGRASNGRVSQGFAALLLDSRNEQLSASNTRQVTRRLRRPSRRGIPTTRPRRFLATRSRPFPERMAVQSLVAKGAMTPVLIRGASWLAAATGITLVGGGPGWRSRRDRWPASSPPTTADRSRPVSLDATPRSCRRAKRSRGTRSWVRGRTGRSRAGASLPKRSV
jgi:hypothetical protein